MTNTTKNQYRDIDYNLEPKFTANSDTDATGLMFAAAVFCAFLTAGVIVYRTGNSDMVGPTVTAANVVMPAAASSGPIDPAPILPTR